MDLRVSSYGVIIDGDRILLAHWSTPFADGWTLPGGGIDPGEDPADAAIREIREETGHDAHLDRLLGIDSIVISAGERLDGVQRDIQAIRVIYETRITGGVLTNEADGTTDEARWFSLSEVAQLDRVDLVDAGVALWRGR